MNQKKGSVRLTKEILEAIIDMSHRCDASVGNDNEKTRMLQLNCYRAGIWAAQELYKRKYLRRETNL